MLIITQRQKIICKADDKTFDNCKTKEDVDKILQGFDKSVLIGGQNGTTGQYYVEGSSDFGFKSLMLLGRAMQTVHLQFRT